MLRETNLGHTTVLQEPHRCGFELKSVQVDEQQAGCTPVQGAAVHDPQ